ncbi:MAG: hypothetical protein SFV15_01135 [Polyangiaceae bacterium]|nr:hypothetical protein [Polyangiaceae bacterium]
MASVKVTITLGDAELLQIKKLATQGKTPNVSAFIQHAVQVALADVAGWGAMLAQALQQTGGPLSNSERAWADSILKPTPRGRGRKRAA